MQMRKKQRRINCGGLRRQSSVREVAIKLFLQGGPRKVIHLVHYITLYERYHFFGLPCIPGTAPRIRWTSPFNFRITKNDQSVDFIFSSPIPSTVSYFHSDISTKTEVLQICVSFSTVSITDTETIA